MSNAKEVVVTLCNLAKEKSVRFPKVWDDVKLTQACGAILLMHRKGDGFDLDACIESLIEKYGQEEVKASPAKKRKAKSEDDEGEEKPESAKKVKKSETMANESNRRVAEAIKEMADLHFKNKDMRKGGVYSKAAKALRECETEITTLKEAMALKGVGKGIAAYVMEMINTGVITKLEEIRAGYA